MKQKSIKNYIAFTLTEMTLVLLIMSVLAAVLTPAITKTISNNAKSLPAEFVVSPWKNITKGYPYNGMYNLGAFNYSMVSIGYRPLSTHTSYRSPALLLRARNGTTKTSIINAPQISILPTGTNDSSNNLNIGIDNNANIGVLRNSTVSARSVNSIFMGQNINVGGTNNYAVNSIYLGNHISQVNGSHSDITIGYNVSKNRYSSGDVVISPSSTLLNNGALKNSVIIGHEAGNNGSSQYDIKIGSNAGENVRNSENNIMIGARAGNLDTKSPSPTISKFSHNVFMGYAAGAVYATQSYPELYRNVFIGNYAGKLSALNINNFSDNILIGNYAGFYVDTSVSSSVTHTRNISIGTYAGFATSNAISAQDAINIGNHSGYNAVTPSYSISIGYYAGSKAKNSNNSIFIGANSDSGVVNNSYTSQNAIIIGYTKRASNWYNGVQNSIRLGANTVNLDGWSNNIAIGYNACGKSGLSNKICIGASSGTVEISSGAWKFDSTPQTFIGDLTYSMSSNYITLYAGSVYAPASSPTAVSDRRLKENIVPSKHSLNDIRKVNIYNYNMKNDKTKSPHIGVIAQEHKKIFPHAVSKHPTFKHYTVSAEWVNFTAVNAVKEIDKNVQQLQKNVKQFIKDFLGLKSRVQKLETKLAKLQKENKEIKAHLNKINAKLN